MEVPLSLCSKTAWICWSFLIICFRFTGINAFLIILVFFNFGFKRTFCCVIVSQFENSFILNNLTTHSRYHFSFESCYHFCTLLLYFFLLSLLFSLFFLFFFCTCVPLFVLILKVYIFCCVLLISHVIEQKMCIKVLFCSEYKTKAKAPVDGIMRVKFVYFSIIDSTTQLCRRSCHLFTVKYIENKSFDV